MTLQSHIFESSQDTWLSACMAAAVQVRGRALRLEQARGPSTAARAGQGAEGYG